MNTTNEWFTANPGPVALELSARTKTARITAATGDPLVRIGVADVRELFTEAVHQSRKLWSSDAAAQQNQHGTFLAELGWPRIYCARTVDRALAPEKQKPELPKGRGLVELLGSLLAYPAAHRRIALDLEDEDRMWRGVSARGHRINSLDLKAESKKHWRTLDSFAKKHGFDVRSEWPGKDGAQLENARRDALKSAWLTARSVAFDRTSDEKWAEPSRCSLSAMPAQFAVDWAEYDAAYQALHRLAPLNSLAREVGEDGLIHPIIRVNQAVSGRMSIQKPAVQSLPYKRQGVRHVVVAERGHSIVSVDHSNAELKVAARLMAEYMGETAFVSRVMTSDVYSAVAEYTGQERNDEKWRVIAFMYGLKEATLAREVGTDQAHMTFEAIHKTVPEIPAFCTEMQRLAAEGHAFTTLLGRPLPCLDGRSHETRFELQTNLLVQGSARDGFGLGVKRAAAALGERALFLPLHDELFVTVPQNSAPAAVTALQEAMTIDLGAGVVLTGTSKVSRGKWGS
jgi:hypothetical protein